MDDQSQTQPDQATSTLGAVAGGIPLAAQQAEAAVTPSATCPITSATNTASTHSRRITFARIIQAVARWLTQLWQACLIKDASRF